MSYSAFGDDDYPKPKSLAAARSRRLSDVFSRHMGVSVSRGLAQVMAGTRTRQGEPAVVQAYGLIVIRRGRLLPGIAQIPVSKHGFDGKRLFGALTPIQVGDVIGVGTEHGTYWFAVEEPFGPTVREVDEPDIDEADDFDVYVGLSRNGGIERNPRARKNSAKSQMAVKLAAKASGRAVPGAGQVAMLVDGAPVAAGELSDFGSQVSGSFRRQKERMKKGSYREAAMAAPREALAAQWALTKGVGRTALAALVAKEAAEMTKKNPALPWQAEAAYLRVLRKLGLSQLFNFIRERLDSYWPDRPAVFRSVAYHDAIVAALSGDPDMPPVTRAVFYAYNHGVNEWLRQLDEDQIQLLADVAQDAVLQLKEDWQSPDKRLEEHAGLSFVMQLLEDVTDYVRRSIFNSPPVAEANPRRRVMSARMNSTKGPYPFAYKEEQYRKYRTDQLRWALRDALKARDAMAGHDLMAENWYADDVHTILTELKRRGEA